MENRDKTSREQEVKRNPDGTFAKGTQPPNTFRERPQDRHNGSWHKEDTPRYWLETMMKMKETDLMKIYAILSTNGIEGGLYLDWRM